MRRLVHKGIVWCVVVSLLTMQILPPALGQLPSGDSPQESSSGAARSAKSKPELTAVVATPFLNEQLTQVDQVFGLPKMESVDLRLAAGAVDIEVRRHWCSGGDYSGLLGPGWRLSWEKRVVRNGDVAYVEENDSSTNFQATSATRYQSASGDQLVFDGGRAVRKTTEGVEERYDGDGRLIEIDARNGNVVRLIRDSMGRLNRVEGPFNVSLMLSVDARGRLTAVRASSGAVVNYYYNNDVLPAGVRGRALRYEYGSNGLPSMVSHPQTGAEKFRYDARGRVIEHVWADDAQEQYEYDDATRSVVRINPNGNRSTTLRAADGLSVERTTAGGSRSTVKFDSRGRVISLTGPSGLTSRMTYDELARPVQIDNAALGKYRFDYQGDTWAFAGVTGPDGRRIVLEQDAANNLRGVRPEDVAALKDVVEYLPNGLAKSLKQNGMEAKFQYDERGRLTAAEDSAGNQTRWEYDNLGNLLRFVDASGNSFGRSYDVEGRLIRTTDADGAEVRFEYDEAGRLLRRIDAEGGATRFDYDACGRLIAQTDSLEHTTRWKYDAAGRLTSETDPAGGVLRYEYDADDRLVREFNALGGVTTNTYDALGNLSSQTDPAGAVRRFEYAPAGQLAKVTDESGATERYEYDARGRILKKTTADGVTARFEYDGGNRLLKVVRSRGPATSYAYDERGNPTSVREGERTLARYEYDELNRTTAAILENGRRVEFRYDAVGNLTAWSDGAAGKNEAEFDAVGRIRRIRDATGNSTKLQYDTAGRLAALVDPLGGVERRSYDLAGNLTEVVTSGGRRASYEYDARGNVAAVRSPDGGRSEYRFDAMGNPVRYVDRLKNESSYVYDVAGRLVRKTDAEGSAIEYRYDATGNLLEKRRSDGPTVRFRYDARSRLTEADDGVFPERWSYDENDNVTEIEYPAIQRKLKYRYDDLGRLQEFVDSENRAITYGYDAADRLIEIHTADGRSIRFEYDANNRRTSLEYPNGVRGAWQYDALGRVSQLTYADKNGKPIAGWIYAYDAAGNCTSVKDSRGRTTSYRYDADGQLLEEASVDGKKINYAYTAGGNRRSRAADDETIEYRYDADDHLLQSGDETFAYDAAGNTVERKGPGGTTRYKYDAEGRLVQVDLSEGKTIEYGYAPTGERIWRRDAGGRTWFVGDGTNLLAELDSKLNVKATYLHGTEMDSPIEMLRAGQHYYFQPDRLGSIREITDGQGTSTASFEYSAFGETSRKSGQLPSPFGFTAREYDAVTGLSYHRARYYDPELGRFLTRDPNPPDLEQIASLNPYCYVCNRPLFFVDPEGAAGNPPGVPPIRIDLLKGMSPAPQPLPPGLDPSMRIHHFTDPSFSNTAVQASLSGGGITPRGGELHVTTLAPGSGSRYPQGIGTPRNTTSSFSAPARDLANAGNIIQMNPNPPRRAPPGTALLIRPPPGETEIRLPRSTRGGGGFGGVATVVMIGAAYYVSTNNGETTGTFIKNTATGIGVGLAGTAAGGVVGGILGGAGGAFLGFLAGGPPGALAGGGAGVKAGAATGAFLANGALTLIGTAGLGLQLYQTVNKPPGNQPPSDETPPKPPPLPDLSDFADPTVGMGTKPPPPDHTKVPLVNPNDFNTFITTNLPPGAAPNSTAYAVLGQCSICHKIHFGGTFRTEGEANAKAAAMSAEDPNLRVSVREVTVGASN